ncbi:4-hydroxybenzoyl-CoA thioesterase [Siccirubricoccus deserti]|uniref:Acyl-CoA thioesterase n=1 Tax=Siccirubricoccus deserti TaxID=2013562 RepID=A0A9X0UIJ9_9PROT|nr:acyl-CoA thioesterase [Siccirubricoccus deserti]MBC4017155.1 acyl-CoA thioesterase [Siccirubricoccus deserti]GGC57267.1 4-hydroxybenzoyl-CoA thioesterase [Siccirubricoccus deserti]
MSGFTRQFLVHWNDCDPAGIVFHANFIRWMDEGFTDFSRSRGVDFVALQRAEPDFRGAPLVDVRCAFRAPARFGDVLTHAIDPPRPGEGRAFHLIHRFLLVDGSLAAEGEQVRIWGRTGPDGVLRAVPMPADIAAKLG